MGDLSFEAEQKERLALIAQGFSGVEAAEIVSLAKEIATVTFYDVKNATEFIVECLQDGGSVMLGEIRRNYYEICDSINNGEKWRFLK